MYNQPNFDIGFKVMSLKLMYITNNPAVAVIAQKYGVDRIWVDLETLGKEERQKNLNSVKSHHTVGDIKRIAPLLDKSEMLVRINPWNDASRKEIDDVIAAGADLVMLPMWKSSREVKDFLECVSDRAKKILLLETREAAECLDEVLALSGIDEIHIGLNDLHLSYGLTFMFELLSNGTVERLCDKIRKAGIAYGFGGIARIGEGALPAEKIILEHYRLGSTRAILSRSFCDAEKIGDTVETDKVFNENMKALRRFEEYAEAADTEIFENNRQELIAAVGAIVGKIKERR